MTVEEITDCVVVGCGFAGATAAIAAHDGGARVVLLEKMPDPGGISVCSFGGVRVARDEAEALRYLRRTNADTAPEEVLAALARGMTRLPDVLARLAAEVGRRTVYRGSPGNYPFPGADTFGFVEIEEDIIAPGEPSFPHVRGAPGGQRLFRMLLLNLARRGIAVRTEARAVRLLPSPDGGVAGVEVVSRGLRSAISARRGVVLAAGGFEGDSDMQRRHWPEQGVLTAAFRGNTGDGIRMAQALGADLWHMWHYHGSYGFRHPDPAYPFGIRTKRLPDWQPGSEPRRDVELPWILLDRSGRRFMNEYEPYLQDTGARPLARYDPVRQDFAALPAWLIADSEGARAWPFGRPTWHERGVGFEWGDDNRAALAAGILHEAADLGALAAATRIDEGRLAGALQRWNALVGGRSDLDWGRPAASMMPVGRPPYVYAPVWPIVSNTQGGPVHDARQRILRPDGTVIPRLYAAGEMGSVFGHLYLSGGNIAECFVGGALAGAGAALG